MVLVDDRQQLLQHHGPDVGVSDHGMLRACERQEQLASGPYAILRNAAVFVGVHRVAVEIGDKDL